MPQIAVAAPDESVSLFRRIYDSEVEFVHHRLLQEQEARELVLAALDRLDLDRRTVLVLHDIEGRGMPEIAELLATSPNTLYSRLRQAREQFIRATRLLRRGEH